MSNDPNFDPVRALGETPDEWLARLAADQGFQFDRLRCPEWYCRFVKGEAVHKCAKLMDAVNFIAAAYPLIPCPGYCASAAPAEKIEAARKNWKVPFNGGAPPPEFKDFSGPLCEDPACYRSRPHFPREWGCRWSEVAIVGQDGAVYSCINQ
jgi:hypothetical protein